MEKKTRIAINGFGRIGRAFYKLARTRPEFEIVAVNDLGDLNNVAYLLKYDTAYGRANFDVTVVPPGGAEEAGFIIDGKKVVHVSEKEPIKLPWGRLGVDIVIESTGFYTSFEKAKVHLDAGAKRVVITAPVKGGSMEGTVPNGNGCIECAPGVFGVTALVGINEKQLAHAQISSNASCTTNAASPVIQILHEAIGIEKAILNTVHGYTATQKLVDSPDAKDWRRGRAAAANIIPSTTGAAIAVTLAVKDLAGRFDGMALRVPVITGSVADITFISKRPTSIEEVNGALKKAAGDQRWDKIFTATDEQIVSSDIIGSHYAAIVDLSFTMVVGGNLVKVLSWYDNEIGYTYALVEHVIKSASYLS